MCLGTTDNLYLARNAAIFLSRTSQKELPSAANGYEYEKKYRREANKDPLWWGAWKINAAFSYRKPGLDLSGPDLSTLGAGVDQKEGTLGRGRSSPSTRFGWKRLFFLRAFIMSEREIVTSLRTCDDDKCAMSSLTESKSWDLKLKIEDKKCKTLGYLAVHIAAYSPLSPDAPLMCKTGSSQQYE